MGLTMVAWIVNDLSLDRQYASSGAFLRDLELLLRQESSLKTAGHSLLCARYLGDRMVTAGLSCRSAVEDWPRTDIRYSLAIRWLTKRKAWDCPPEGQGVTYFHAVDVTNQGLGEAARRRWLNEDARTYSFCGLVPCEATPLDVTGLREGAETEEIIPVPNAWSIDEVAATFLAPTPPSGWTAMVNEACDAFTGLAIAHDQIVKEMSRYPFDKGARDALYGILKILNDLALRRNQGGDGSKPVTEWMATYVQNHAAMFSSEDPQDNNVFRFEDPETGERIYCPWHGKVHNPLQYRVHYQWPIPQGQKKLKVLYIGDKLTKW